MKKFALNTILLFSLGVFAQVRVADRIGLATKPSWGTVVDSATALPSNCNKQTVTVFTPTTINVNTYNHHVVMYVYKSIVYLMTSTGNSDEDDAGQYVRYSYSSNYGQTWTTHSTLIPPISAVGTAAGAVLTPAKFIEYNSRLYAIVNYNAKSALETPLAILAIDVEEATKGTPFFIYPTSSVPTAPSGYPQYAYNSTYAPSLRSLVVLPQNYPVYDYSVKVINGDLHSGYIEISTSVIDLGVVQFARKYPGSDKFCYYRTSNSGLPTSAFVATAIPSAPSVTLLKRLSDSRYACITNTVVATTYSRKDMIISIATDRLKFFKSYFLESNISETPTYSGVAKGGGSAYFDSVEINGKLIVGWSRAKEEVKVTIIDLKI